MFLQALLELDHDLHRWAGHPRIAESGRWIFLFWVGDEIECLRAAKLRGRRPPVSLLVVENYLPVPPLDRFQAIRHEDRKTFALGFLGFAEQEITLVHSIDRAILWHGCAGDLRECCVGVDLVDYLVTNTAGRDSTGPADDEWHPEGAFHVREVVTAPRADDPCHGQVASGPLSLVKTTIVLSRIRS